MVIPVEMIRLCISVNRVTYTQSHTHAHNGNISVEFLKMQIFFLANPLAEYQNGSVASKVSSDTQYLYSCVQKIQLVSKVEITRPSPCIYT